MKKFVMAAVVAAFAFVAVPVLAAPKTYQVTGPVLEVGADKIVVQKGSEKWEIAVAPGTIPADVKVGTKITVQYSMTAASITAKK